eukprot:CAMPEP_0204320460 /NCGR_PEP_ID=MMETSP0469-20131031/7653_1 /ASSEMBLY_ACC=CAM_ASM_000384 /TAXON_ID=2969 /ORGANISM="Oxyrrhis marina" /LENGTH=672 /DNA_ID=CAMNT_0051301725 /DNA_START=27 /DNA_END=2045 /DNA_ORIENTATION=-
MRLLAQVFFTGVGAVHPVGPYATGKIGFLADPAVSLVQDDSSDAVVSFEQRDEAVRKAPFATVATPSGLDRSNGVTVSYSPDTKQLTLKAGVDQTGVAWATFQDTLEETGWSNLYVSTTDDSNVSNDVKMYAAGFAEGQLTANRISDFRVNVKFLQDADDEQHHSLDNIRADYNKKAAHIETMGGLKAGSSLEKEPDSNFFKHARYILLQSYGIIDAYNSRSSEFSQRPLGLTDFFLLNADGERDELEVAYSSDEESARSGAGSSALQTSDDDEESGLSSETAEMLVNPQLHASFLQRRAGDIHHLGSRQQRESDHIRALDRRQWETLEKHGHCSALVRLAPNNGDLFVAHATWSPYSDMTRIWKYYNFPLNDAGVAAKNVGFSSYPSAISSTDDYYLCSSGVVITETTLSLLKDSPYDKVNDGPTTVPDFFRVMIANRLAGSSEDWVNLMKQSATGTYSSQWMAVDYNKFQKGQPVPQGTLFVLEQVPGRNEIRDESDTLNSQGFWSSANRPVFDQVRAISGDEEATAEHGDIFSANNNPRAKIFRNTAPQVATLMDMRHEMQRNKGKAEGIDNVQGPGDAIAARFDLVVKDSEADGATDAKVTSSCLAKQMMADAISGPSHQDQPPFNWNEKNGRFSFMPHQGQPDTWNFDWMRMSPTSVVLATGDAGSC